MTVTRRYPLPGWEEFYLKVPKGSVVELKELRHQPYLYIRMNPGAPVIKKKFKMSMGRELPPEYTQYVGSINGANREFYLFTDGKEYE